MNKVGNIKPAPRRRCSSAQEDLCQETAVQISYECLGVKNCRAEFGFNVSQLNLIGSIGFTFYFLLDFDW